jgi:hypothetical protein
MADEVAEENSDYDDESESDEYELYDDDALRGFRFFNNNINGEEHDEDDVEEETFVNEEEEESEAGAEDDAAPPPVPYLAQKLVEQGVTMEQLLKAVLCSCHDYQRDYEDFERVESEIVGRITTILNNYTPAITTTATVTSAITSATTSATTTTTGVWSDWL